MDTRGAGLEQPYDDGDLSDDGEGFEAGDADDTAALMEAVRTATEMLAAEGVGDMVGFQPIEGSLALLADSAGLPGDAGDPWGGDWAMAGEPEASTSGRHNLHASTAQHMAFDEEDEDEDEDLGLMPDDLVSDEDSDYEGSDGQLTSEDGHDMTEYQDTLRSAAGFRRKQAGKKRQAKRPAPVYSAAVQQLLGEANRWYVGRELDRAFTTFSSVIREDPSCAPAWTTMALIREEQGRTSDAVQLYTVAALLANDPALWERLYTMHMSVADATEAQALAGDAAAAEAYNEATKQALSCLSSILQKNPLDRESWRRRLELMEKRGDHHGLARSYRTMLRVDPHRMETIRMASVLYAKQRGDLDTPLKWFSAAFAFYNQQALELAAQAARQVGGGTASGSANRGGNSDSGSSSGDEDDSEGDAASKDGDADKIDAEWAEYLARHPTCTVPMEDLDGYSYGDLNMVAELRLLRHEHAQAVVDIKRGARFVQGRGREHQWNGRELQDETDAEYDDSELPIELRVKLGQCRLVLGQLETAEKHIAPLLELDVAAYEDLYMDVAETYAEAGCTARALDVYQMLASCTETNQPPVWERLAKCQRDLGDLAAARTLAEAVVEADPGDADMRLWLGEVYDEMGDTELAYQMINTVEEMHAADHGAVAADQLARQLGRSRIGSADDGGAQNGERKPSEHTRRRRRDAEDERQRSLAAMRAAEVAFKKLDLLRPQLDGSRRAVREYCAVAKRLLADWRRIRAFYLADRSRPFQTYRNIVITNLERDAQSGELGPLAEASGQAAMRRQMDRMKRRLARQQRPQDDDGSAGGRPTTFRGHSFDRWLDMFLEYARCLALDRRVNEALDVLDVVSQSSVYFHDATQSRTLHLMMLSVALNGGADDRLYELLRWWCGSHPTKAIRYRLFAFAMATSASAAAVLTSGNVYKFFRRLLDQLDGLYYREHGAREPLARDHPVLQPPSTGPDHGPEAPVAANGLTKSDIAALHSVAAHLMLVSRIGAAPLAQYTLALGLVPHDASVALHLGVAYLVHSARREVANTQAVVLRGLTYIQRYAELRCMQELRSAGRPPPARPDVIVTQEIAYNLARAFHFVGLLDLAATHYTLVFGLPVSLAGGDDGGSGGRAFSDLRRDAAYNLASIYVASGSPLRARALLVEHCTID